MVVKVIGCGGRCTCKKAKWENSKILLEVLINKGVFNFRCIFSIGGEHFKFRAYRIYIYFYAEKFFVSYFEVWDSWLVAPTLE